jgi:hypothetical protein
MPTRDAELTGLLDEIGGLLRAHGEDRWAEWVEADAELIRAGDGRGVDHFLAAFGATGGLYELVFHPYTGNAQSPEEGRAATAQRHELMEHAQRLAADMSMALAAPGWPEYDEGDGFRDTPEAPEAPDAEEEERARRRDFEGY